MCVRALVVINTYMDKELGRAMDQSLQDILAQYRSPLTLIMLITRNHWVPVDGS